MSHEITSEDNLVLAGVPAWHGLGLVVEKAPTVREALKLAGLDWLVERGPMQVVGGRFDGLKVPDSVALIREDTSRVLGVVGDGYEVLQNEDVAGLIEELATEGACAKAESAGSIRYGRNVWFLVPRGEFTLAGADRVAEYLLFANTHDGSGAFSIVPTTIRVVCNNTLTAALSGIKVRHSKSMPERVRSAKAALLAGDLHLKGLRAKAERMAAVPMDAADLQAFFLKVYEASYGVIPAKPQDAAEERRQRKAIALVSEWVANLETPRNPGSPTAWTALNAVTEWADHKRTVRETGAVATEREARAFSRVLGSAADFKAKALDVALAVSA
jgi:phage/plasmid-like protein (TIGR03299 family)